MLASPSCWAMTSSSRSARSSSALTCPAKCGRIDRCDARFSRASQAYPPETAVSELAVLECTGGFFFSSLRFLVAVFSALSGFSWVLKPLFSKRLRRSGYSRSLLRSLVRSFFFIADFHYALKFLAQHSSRRALHQHWRSVLHATQGAWVE